MHTIQARVFAAIQEWLSSYAAKAIIALMMVVAANSTPVAANDGWHAIGPLPRDRHAMAYDSARGVMVMFGGKQRLSNYFAGFLGDTWEFSGAPDSDWEPRVIMAPSPRYAHSMVYDSVRRVTILFGGVTAHVGAKLIYSGETWEYDGTAWTLRSVKGPSPRAFFAMTFDSARGVTVLHGGNDGVLNGETWEYDGNSWQLRTSAGPAPRFAHALAFDSNRNVCVMYGGATAPGAADSQTWEYDGTAGTWVDRTNSTFNASFLHTLAFDPIRNVTVRWGGDPFYGFHEWNGHEWTGVSVAGGNNVLHRYSHATAYDSARQVMVSFGGYDDNGSVWNDTWEIVEINGSLQAIERNPAPHAGALQIMFYDSQRHVACLHFSDVMWEWDGASQAWTKRLTSGPSAGATSIVYDSQRNVAVLFGGYSYQNGLLGDTWEWEGHSGTWTLKSTAGPTPRQRHAMAFDAARGVTVLFGGAPSGQLGSDETWEWNGAVWTQRNFAAAPPPRSGHAMVFDAHRNVTVLFGGHNGTIKYNDTWEFDGAQWTLRSNIGPSPYRADFAMTYDSVHHQTILFGGYGSPYLNDVWTWNGTAWKLRALMNAPEPRLYSAMTFDSDQQNTIIVGGIGDHGPQRDQWLLCLPATCSGDVAPAYGDGQVNVSDLLGVINQWGACPTPCAASTCAADINGDCQVNVNDLLAVINHWGACP